MTVDNERKFKILVKDISSNSKSMQMKNYIQHGRITTYDHCMSVAKMAYMLEKGLKISCNENELIRGAFLHDYFLYDWHNHKYEDLSDKKIIFYKKLWKKYIRLHGFTHPQIAMENAMNDFDLSDNEQLIIKSHMWPLTITSIPKSREAFLVCMADKIVSLKETLFMR